MVEAFPSPKRVREEMRQGDQPAAAVSLIIAAHILEAAAYLEQHGEQAQSLSRRARRRAKWRVAKKLQTLPKSITDQE
jgi:hypothetical protein